MRKEIKKVDYMYCLGKQVYENVYKVLLNQLGTNCVHVLGYVTVNNSVVWEIPDDDNRWISLTSDEGSFVKAEVQALIKKCRKEVMNDAILKPVAEALFTYPDDSFIFFSQSNGKLSVRITGWGYKHPQSTNSPIPGYSNIEKSQDVRIGFKYLDSLLPNYTFFLNNNLRETDIQGLYDVGSVEIGRSCQIKDSGKKKDFTLTVEKGKHDYIFDLTSFFSLKIVVVKDGSPLQDAVCKISYRGVEYSGNTGEDGILEILDLVYYQDECCLVVVDDLSKQTSVLMPQTELKFEFTSPIEDNNESEEPEKKEILEEPEELEKVEENLIEPNKQEDEEDIEVEEPELPVEIMPRIKVVGEPNDDGSEFVMTGYPISLLYNDSRSDYLSDNDGCVYIGTFACGDVITVVDRVIENNRQTYEIEEDEYIFYVPFKNTNFIPDIIVHIRDYNNRPILNGYVHFNQESFSHLSRLDENGDAFINRSDFVIDKPIQTNIIVENREFIPVDFRLKDNEDEYTVRVEKRGSAFGIILLELLLVLLSIIALYYLLMYFLGFCSYFIG